MEDKKIYSNKKLKKNLDYLLRNKGITKKALELELGVGEGYLSRVTREGATQEPSVQLMKNLSDKLGVTIDVLLYQDIKIEEDKIKSDNNTIKLIDKLIEETKSLELRWNNFDLTPYGHNARSIETDLYYYRSFDEGISVFESKYGRKYENIRGNESKAWYAYLNNGTHVILVNLKYSNGEAFLELYLNNDEKGYPICSNGFGNYNIDIYLENLYKCINYDVEESIVNKLIEDYLDKNKEESVNDYKELPF